MTIVLLGLYLLFIAILFFVPHRLVRGTSILAGSVIGVFSSYLFFSFLSYGNNSIFSIDLGMNYVFRIDNFNASLILLNGLISFSVPLATHIKERERDFYILMFTVLLGTAGLFLTQNIILFVLFYELASVPMYFLIARWGSWGVTPFRRVSPDFAAWKLFLYLQVGGALVMLGFFILHSLVFGYDIFTGWNFQDYEKIVSKGQVLIEEEWVAVLIFFLFFIAFGIEAALVPFHTWLPDGHSAAPSSISMILAGVLLKMGTYGILRVPIVFFPEVAEKYGIVLIVFGVLNLVYGAINAFRQIDIKYLIAYSSISHMGAIFIGLGANNDLGIAAAVFQMVSHGLISALLFSIAGSLQYRTNTRLIDNYGGLLRIIPFIGTMLVFAGMANLGLPGLSGFVAELLSLSALIKKLTGYTGVILVIISLIGVFITAVYVLNLIDKTLYRKVNPIYSNIDDAHWDEKLHMLVLSAFILILGIFPFVITDISNLSEIRKILGM
ncbi:MAG: NADH-quinone oxidoreductase subunit M [Candidatus Calescibacterium sp.]|nr:NADH-quinone oxidoreductase subunit M [Candidatus Calescibacterium sp.]MDW8195550.1 NADH-quinone oxidoreductase subunit M [Candidatus Calescibacterium sp.]